MDSFYKVLVVPLLFLIPTVALAFPIWAFRRKKRYSPLVENRLRLPAESTRRKMFDLGMDVLGQYLAMLVLIVVLVFCFFVYRNHVLAFTMVGIVCVGCLGYLAYRMYFDFRKVMNYRLGVDGEEYTGQELNLLAWHGAFVFHDIPYKYGNIDHVVVGFDAIFAVETKAVRKPGNAVGEKEGRVVFDGNKLIFPHFTTKAPLKQAQCHADYLRNVLLDECGSNIPVIPVVAIPGWFIDSDRAIGVKIVVMNPKRGSYLRKRIGQRRTCEQFNSAVAKVQRLARNEAPLSSITDPDAGEHYNLWTTQPKVKNI